MADNLTEFARAGYDGNANAHLATSPAWYAHALGRYLHASGRSPPRNVRMGRGDSIRVNDMRFTFTVTRDHKITFERVNPHRKARTRKRAAVTRPKRRRAIRKNPVRKTSRYVIAITQNRQLLEFDGHKFTDERKPYLFISHFEALRTAKRILAMNPKIERLGYKMHIKIAPAPALKKNPSVREGLEQANERLEKFSGHKATEVLRVIDRNPKTGLVIGDLDGVLYTTVRDGEVEKYIHRFRRKSRPLLAASSDGKTLKIVGGRFEFTEAGIVDR